MPQQFNSCHNAVLTERKSTHAMIAGRTQPACTLIALNHRRILSMVATVHHFVKTYLPTDCYAVASGLAGESSADPLLRAEAPVFLS